MNWYQWQMDRGYLGIKRKPEGNSVVAPMAGIPYRVPLSDQSHIITYEQIHSDDPTFGCGRSVYVDPEWYAASGAHLRWGMDPYLLPDTRANGQCSQCKTAWKKQLTEKRRIEEYSKDATQADINPNIDYKTMRNQWMMEEKKLSMKAAMVARMLGGEVLE